MGQKPNQALYRGQTKYRPVGYSIAKYYTRLNMLEPTQVKLRASDPSFIN